MKRLWPLVWLGLGAFVLFALVTLPASVVLSRLNSPSVNIGGVSGSIWHGRAQAVQLGGATVGSIEWNLHVLPLFIAHATADVKLSRADDGFANARVSASPNGKITLSKLTASLPLSALPANVIPGGWAGTLNARADQLTLEKGWPTQVNGTLDAANLRGPAQHPSDVGSYHIVFDPAASTAEALKGAITDAGDGPLEITGTVQLKPDHSYTLDALIAARPNAPKSLVSSLEYLGPPDAQGRRQFSMAGTM